MSNLRVRSPAATYADARQVMFSLGITRVTDVTRMDRLGLPVFASIRPRGLALCVHAGKSLRVDEARVGALMEAVEYAAAEPLRSTWASRNVSLRELLDEWDDDLALPDLAPCMEAVLDPARRLDVVMCEDVAGGRALPLPAELLFVPYDPPDGDDLFGWSTNGLASGNTAPEATLHALLEVLERDALAMNLAYDESALLHPRDVPEPVAGLLAQWQELDVSLAIRHVPNAFGLACFRVLLHEGGRAFVDLSGGYGLHPDPRRALERAVCEAAQSRLSHIHGGRDDITRFYEKWSDERQPPPDATQTRAYQEAFDSTRTIRWADIPHVTLGEGDVDSALASLLVRLRDAGFPRVLRHRFDVDLNGLHVVKVVVPGCQEIDTPWRRLGRRLLERVAAHA